MNINIDLTKDLDKFWDLKTQDRNYDFLYYGDEELKNFKFFFPNVSGHKYFLIFSSTLRKKYSKKIEKVWNYKKLQGYEPGLFYNRKTGETQVFPVKFSFSKLDNVVLEGVLGNHKSLSNYKLFTFFQAHFNLNGKVKSIYHIQKNKLTKYLDNLKFMNNQIISIFQECYSTKYLEHYTTEVINSAIVPINGINFINSNSSKRLLWIFENVLDKPVTSILDLIDWDEDIVEEKTEYKKLITKFDSEIKKKPVFAIMKVGTTDCYELYCLNSETKTDFEYIYIDEALIPTLELSSEIRETFKKSDELIPFICTFDNEHQKWIPNKKTTRKITSYKKIIEMFA